MRDPAKKILCVGAGPAGLYFAILAALQDPHYEITVVERNPRDAPCGWGVTFSDHLLDTLFRSDPVSASQLAAARVTWTDQHVRLPHEPVVHLGGYGFGISRWKLLDILTERAVELGVRIHYGRAPAHANELSGTFDLVVAADGAGSRIRRQHEDAFGTVVEIGTNHYIWLSTTKHYHAFTYAFERTAAGWLWFYAYRHDANCTTLIVECGDRTWRDLNFDALDIVQAVERLELILADHLDGHRLMSTGGGWQEFTHVDNKRWIHENIVLIGDAAHTTHFSMGFGTALAMSDAVELAGQLRHNDSVADSLAVYDERRRRAFEGPRDVARRSAAWFEDLDKHMRQDSVEFAFAMWRRRLPEPVECRERCRMWARWRLHLFTQHPSGRMARRVLRRLRSALRALYRSGLRRGWSV